MCDITNRNFNDKYSDIVKDISAADFISIDCEFSGLIRHDRNKLSLFDNPTERYEKLRRGSNDFIALQIGMSLFTYNRLERYEVTTYTFHLFPRSYSAPDYVFACDASSIQFLCEQNFDFNKVFRDGITFSNGSNEEAIRRDINDGSLVRRMRLEMSPADRETMQSLCGQVRRWRTQAECGDTLALNLSEVEPFLTYLIRDEIEAQHRDVRVHRETWTRLVAEKVVAGERNRAGQDDQEEESRKEELYALVLGFTRLVNDLVSMRKPVVGHNMFMDVLMLYKMFIAPLPEDYSRFKTEALSVFPEVYDTKFLSFELKRMIGRKDLWSSNALNYLYKYFKEGGGASVVLDMPIIDDRAFQHTPRCEHYHNSGFDSYCTGYVFLKMAHMFSMWDDTDKNFKRVSLGNGPVRYLGAVRGMRNCINVIRGNTAHISLDGPDPGTNRPDLILVESRGRYAIDVTKISDVIAKYDKADIKPLSARRALIATSSELTAKMIFRHFAKDTKLRLSKYRGVVATRRGAFNRGAVGMVVLGVAALVSVFCYKKFLDPFRSSGNVR